MKKKNTQSPGSGLIFAMIVLFVILAFAIAISAITVTEQKMSQKNKSSVGAFFNADSGVEWAINKIANTAETSIDDAFGGVSMFNADGSVKCPNAFDATGAEVCKVFFLDDAGKVIPLADISGHTKLIDDITAVRSVGTNFVGGTADTTRAIEAAVASSEKYQLACGYGPSLFICCRIDTESGATGCKKYDQASWTSTNGADPW